MSTHASCAICRSSWQETKNNGRLQPKLFCNFFQRSTGEITLCTLCFTEFEKVFHIFHPFAECDVFGVRQKDRLLRSVFLDDLWVKIQFHGRLAISFAPMQDSVNDNFIRFHFKKNSVIANSQSIAGLKLDQPLDVAAQVLS
jgi:hypothetical protein